MDLQVEDVSGDEEQERDEPPPPSVPFFRLFAYADPLDWLLMVVGSIAAAVHGAALPVYLYVLGRIINLFGQYQQDILSKSGHQLSSSSFQSLADELSKVEHLLVLLCSRFLFNVLCNIKSQSLFCLKLHCVEIGAGNLIGGMGLCGVAQFHFLRPKVLSRILPRNKMELNMMFLASISYVQNSSRNNHKFAAPNSVVMAAACPLHCLYCSGSSCGQLVGYFSTPLLSHKVNSWKV